MKYSYHLPDVGRLNLSRQKHVLSILFMGLFIMFLTYLWFFFAAILGSLKF